MNNKALVEIRIPATGETFEVLIPLESRMSEVVELVAKVLTDLSDGKYKAGCDAVLCDAATGIIYNINKAVGELGITNGSRLLLI